MTQLLHGALAGFSPDIQAQVVAKAFWALGHPVRMRIVEILLDEEELTVSDLVKQLPVSQPQVSVHLACLTDCGFTAVRREGRHAFYRVTSPWAVGVISLMRDHAEEHTDELLACAGCDRHSAAPILSDNAR